MTPHSKQSRKYNSLYTQRERVKVGVRNAALKWWRWQRKMARFKLNILKASQHSKHNKISPEIGCYGPCYMTFKSHIFNKNRTWLHLLLILLLRLLFIPFYTVVIHFFEYIFQSLQIHSNRNIKLELLHSSISSTAPKKVRRTNPGTHVNDKQFLLK